MTTYIVVATISDKRWFDLDAERTPYGANTIANNRRAVTEGRYTEDRKGRAGPDSPAMSTWALTHDGAPPLDCWIDGDPWTQTPPPQGEPMSRCLYHVGDTFHHMATIPDHSVDLIVTSPPFLALRSYLPADHPNKDKEIGSETTPAAFLSTLLALTREWRRVLAPHGSIAVELGDTYAGSGGGGGGGDYLAGGTREGQQVFAGSATQARHREDCDLDADCSCDALMRASNAAHWRQKNQQKGAWPLPKSLCLIPTLYAASLAYGHNLLNPDDTITPWRIRNLIVWHRPNPPVGALGDKVRPATSYITTACTSDKRWFDLDAERTNHDPASIIRSESDAPRRFTARVNASGVSGTDMTRPDGAPPTLNPAGAPPLDCWIDGDVWTIPTHPYKGAHYATYPTALPRRLINLMCPREVCVQCGEPRRRITGEAEYVQSRNGGTPAVMDMRDGVQLEAGVVRNWSANGAAKGDNSVTRTAPTLGWTDCGHNNFRRGVVLDPFAGSGTTAVAASESGRDSILIDLDERNLHLARERIGLFLEEATQ